ncbi:hypothetical protein [Paraflavitalea speifideaquila]|uniref:hypothetical protein n=1 Tax=Paraflavitalea speifideaquila TaxID=3076558 RepID=UPI0028E2BEAE|nr:hypothetical protein [Paraflavitalea speifideiaquila]
MKQIFLYISIAGMLVLASCSKEAAIVPREDSPFGTRYEFPQGNHAYDAAAKEVFDQFGIRFIYTGFDSTHLNRAWQGSTQIYSGKPLNDEQATYQINFLKDKVFSFLKPEYAKDIFPPYLYLVYNYYYPSGTSKVYNTVYPGGVDFWVNALFTEAQSAPPVPAAKLKETRVKILAHAIKIAYDRKKINDAPAFHSLFDYVTEIKQYSFEGEHFSGTGDSWETWMQPAMHFLPICQLEPLSNT